MAFFRMPKTTNHRLFYENQGFAFTECGGEGEIRTPTSIAVIQALRDSPLPSAIGRFLPVATG